VVAVVSWPGGEQGEQFVGDVVVRDARPVVIAGPQHQREHVLALLEVRVGQRIRDQLSHDFVVAPPVAHHPTPRAPGAVVAPDERRHHRHSRAENHDAWQQLSQLRERVARGAEHCPQDCVEGDVHEGLERRELVILGPGSYFAPRLLLDDVLVRRHALAVERRDEQLAPRSVFGAVQTERRARAENQSERAAAADHIRVRREDVLHEFGVADHYRPAERGKVQHELRAIALAQQRGELRAGQDERDGLNNAGQR
jgi:hypothetical protein